MILMIKGSLSETRLSIFLKNNLLILSSAIVDDEGQADEYFVLIV
jgi:hypothetical protein